jgi:AbrB family looped-hinge helix DNA binding protein
MSSGVAVRMDSEGRVTVPPEVQAEAGLAPGDELLLVVRNGTVELIPSGRAIDILAEEALVDYREGRTKSLREFAAEVGVTFDGP